MEKKLCIKINITYINLSTLRWLSFKHMVSYPTDNMISRLIDLADRNSSISIQLNIWHWTKLDMKKRILQTNTEFFTFTLFCALFLNALIFWFICFVDKCCNVLCCILQFPFSFFFVFENKAFLSLIICDIYAIPDDIYFFIDSIYLLFNLLFIYSLNLCIYSWNFYFWKKFVFYFD